MFERIHALRVVKRCREAEHAVRELSRDAARLDGRLRAERNEAVRSYDALRVALRQVWRAEAKALRENMPTRRDSLAEFESANPGSPFGI